MICKSPEEYFAEQDRRAGIALNEDMRQFIIEVIENGDLTNPDSSTIV
jgi:hypothetical protein